MPAFDGGRGGAFQNYYGQQQAGRYDRGPPLPKAGQVDFTQPQPGPPMPQRVVHFQQQPSQAAVRGDYMAREAAARGGAMIEVQQQYDANSRAGVAARRQKKPEITPKITGNSPVLPARRRAEAEAMRLEQQQQAWAQAAAAWQHQRGGAGGYQGGYADEAPVPQLSVEEQREHDAMATALRNELASTEIHMQVLEGRQAKLRKRLESMGEAA